jgi:hypothetical protein
MPYCMQKQVIFLWVQDLKLRVRPQFHGTNFLGVSQLVTQASTIIRVGADGVYTRTFDSSSWLVDHSSSPFE